MSSTFGSAHNARATASICCSPPLRSFDRCGIRSRRIGNRPRTQSTVPRPCPEPSDRCAGFLRPSGHRTSGDPAAHGNAVLRHPMGGNAGEPAPSARAAALWPDQSHDRLECRGLARAVAAQQAHDFADIDAEREVPEHPDVPVIGEDAVDRSIIRPIARRTSALAWTSPGVPSTRTIP